MEIDSLPAFLGSAFASIFSFTVFAEATSWLLLKLKKVIKEMMRFDGEALSASQKLG